MRIKLLFISCLLFSNAYADQNEYKVNVNIFNATENYIRSTLHNCQDKPLFNSTLPPRFSTSFKSAQSPGDCIIIKFSDMNNNDFFISRSNPHTEAIVWYKNGLYDVELKEND